jgi:hypothetical protein
MFASYLLARGWTRYGAGFQNHAGDRYLDLSGDYGWAWELSAFMDCDDADGVARVMWVNMNAQGDTLAELAAALGRLDRRAAAIAA